MILNLKSKFNSFNGLDKSISYRSDDETTGDEDEDEDDENAGEDDDEEEDTEIETEEEEEEEENKHIDPTKAAQIKKL
jgi:hypothetical protein